MGFGGCIGLGGKMFASAASLVEHVMQFGV